MADITEAKIYEALGLGAKVQEPAEPAAQPSTVEPAVAEEPGIGEQVQEPAEPAQQITNPTLGTTTEAPAATADPEEPEEDADDGAGVGDKPQTVEERRANAARRREQERQEAIDAAVQEAIRKEQQKTAAQMETFFAGAGLKNSFTGESITNMEQFNAWKEQMAKEARNKALQSGGLTQEMLDEMIANHPALKQAAALVSQGEQAQQQAAQKQFMADVEHQLAEIQKMDPTIHRLEDLVKMPDAKEFREIINRTRCTYLEAFRLLRMEKNNASQAEAARQQAMNLARSKEHLQPTANVRGSGAVSVPDADMKMYKLFNPGATEAQIQKHFNQQLKK